MASSSSWGVEEEDRESAPAADWPLWTHDWSVQTITTQSDNHHVLSTGSYWIRVLKGSGNLCRCLQFISLLYKAKKDIKIRLLRYSFGMQCTKVWLGHWVFQLCPLQAVSSTATLSYCVFYLRIFWSPGEDKNVSWISSHFDGSFTLFSVLFWSNMSVAFLYFSCNVWIIIIMSE